MAGKVIAAEEDEERYKQMDIKKDLKTAIEESKKEEGIKTGKPRNEARKA